MNDLEICKRIAEIEFDDLIDCYEHEFDGICIDKPMCGMVFREAYNPLTDDALCFQLMVKYGVERRILDGIVYYSIPFKSSMYQAEPDCDSTAVSLAIIEAHKCS